MFAVAVPSAAPDDVAVEVINSSVVKVSWTRVHKDKLHGHLGGYRVILQKQTFAFFKRNGPDLALNILHLSPPLCLLYSASAVHRPPGENNYNNSFRILSHLHLYKV